MTKYIPATEVAKMVRQELKATFPGQKFSVRTSSGRTLDIEWTDGPAEKAVDGVVSKYAGEGFDGMTDMRYYNDNGTDENGEAISYGTSFVFTRRNISPEVDKALRAEIVADIVKYQGVSEEEVQKDNRYWDCPQVIASECDRWVENSVYVYVRMLAEARAAKAGK